MNDKTTAPVAPAATAATATPAAQPVATAEATPTVAPVEPTGKQAKVIDDYSGKRVFAATQHADALSYLAELQACSDFDTAKIVSNIGDGGITEGQVVVIAPYNEREVVETTGKKEQHTIGFLILQVPSLEDFNATVVGSSFILDQLYGRLAQSWLGITRKNMDENNGEAGELPTSVEMFVAITQRTRSGADMSAFNKYWKHFADWFKSRNITIKKATLQLYMSNKAEALRGAEKLENLVNEQVPNGLFVAFINQMISKCEADRIDPSVLQHWLATRDNQEAEVIEMSFDLDDLGAL